MKKWIWIISVILVAVFAFVIINNGVFVQDAQAGLSDVETFEVTIDTLSASIGATGRVRANQSATLTWDISGEVGEVDVQTGEIVTDGQTLASLEQTSLSQSIILARADLVSAKQALDELLNSRNQQAEALLSVENAEEALEDALNPDELSIVQAEQAIVDAEKAVDDAQRDLNYTNSTASQASIDAAEAEVVLARDALEKAEDKFEPYENKPEDNLIRANLQSNLAAAQQSYDAKVRNLNALLGTSDELDIAVAEANLATAQAALINAQEEYDLLVNGPSEGELAKLESQIEDAKREWERLKNGPDPDDIAAADARVAAAEATLAQATITAPFDGVVTLIESKPGDQVDLGVVAFQVDDLSRLLVDLEVSEIDINQIQIGQTVELTFDAIFSKVYHGEVVEVAMVGSESGGVVNFKVTIELTDPDDAVKPGMTAAVDIVTTEIANVLIIPNKSVRVQDGEKVVYLVSSLNPLTYTAIPITLGASSDTQSQIIAGDIEAGDVILYNPSSDITSGESGFGPGANNGGFFSGE
jgi:HlyD family secretion protein